LSPTCLAFRRFLLEHAEPFLESEYSRFALRPSKRAALKQDGRGAIDTGARR